MWQLACALFDESSIDGVRLTCQEQHNRQCVAAAHQRRPHTPTQAQSAKALSKASAPWWRNPDRPLHRLVVQGENLETCVRAARAEEEIYRYRERLLAEPLDALQRAASDDSDCRMHLVDLLTGSDAEAATKARERTRDAPAGFCPKRTELQERATKLGLGSELVHAALESADEEASSALVRAIYEMLKLGSKYTPAFIPAARATRAQCIDGPLGPGVYSPNIRRRTIAWMTVLASLPCNADGIGGLWRLQGACCDRAGDDVALATVFQYSPFREFVDTLITNVHQRPIAELCIAGAVLGIEIQQPWGGNDENIGVLLAHCVREIFEAMGASDLSEARLRAHKEGCTGKSSHDTVMMGIPAPVVIGPVTVCEGEDTDWMFAYDRWELDHRV